MKKKGTVVSITLSIALLITSLPLTWSGSSKAANDYGLENPKVAYFTRDIVEFGHYWQEDTNGDGVANTNDAKTPIRWQVLERNGNELFLLSEKTLDCQPYHNKSEAITWELCSLRTWLNNEFYNNAFSSVEKIGIKECNIINPDNSSTGIDGGNDTKDNLFLLSLDEINGYGFNESYNCYDQARHGKVTAFAERKGLSANLDSASWWWLRSPGGDACAAFVDSSGSVFNDGDMIGASFGVRPALRINLSLVSNQVKDSGKENIALKASSWDTVTFGMYEGSTLKWRVLNVSGDEALLLADSIVDSKPYNAENTSITWKGCTLRTWLNNDFYNGAFTSAQKNAIKSTTLVNSNNPYFGTLGGDNTSDKIFLLSLSEVTNPEYGFPSAFVCYSDSRIAHKVGNTSTEYWWLRSPGSYTYTASHVYGNGYIKYYGFNVNYDYGVRPALRINLSSSVWTKGDKVIAGDEAALATPTPTPTVTPTPSPSPTPTPTKTPTIPPPTATPTVTPTATPTATPTITPTAKPDVTAVPAPTLDPDATIDPDPTAVPEQPTETPSGETSETGIPTAVPSDSNAAIQTPTPAGNNIYNIYYTNPIPEKESGDNQSVKKGMKFFAGNLQYKVTSAKINQYEVSVIKVKNKKAKSITIDSIVVYKGNNFKITGIGKKFASSCTKLKKINIKSKYIKKIEKKAFAGIKSKYKILVVKSKLKKYVTMIKKSK